MLITYDEVFRAHSLEIEHWRSASATIHTGMCALSVCVKEKLAGGFRVVFRWFQTESQYFLISTLSVCDEKESYIMVPRYWQMIAEDRSGASSVRSSNPLSKAYSWYNPLKALQNRHRCRRLSVYASMLRCWSLRREPHFGNLTQLDQAKPDLVEKQANASHIAEWEAWTQY